MIYDLRLALQTLGLALQMKSLSRLWEEQSKTFGRRGSGCVNRPLSSGSIRHADLPSSEASSLDANAICLLVDSILLEAILSISLQQG